MKRSVQWLGSLMLLVCAAYPGITFAATTLEHWRARADEVRLLIENDAPRAQLEALRLSETVPPGATPADQARALNLLARAELYLGLTEDTGKHAQAARDLAEHSGDAVGQVEANLVIALNAVNAARFDQLTEASRRAMERMQDIPDRPDLLSEVMLRTGMLYRRMGVLDDAIDIALKNMEIAQRSGNPFALAYAHHGMGIAYEQSERPKESREHYALMLNAARAARSRALQISALLGLGYMNSKLGELGDGERNHREALDLARKLGGPFYIAHAAHGLAGNLARQQRHEEATAFYDENVHVFERGANIIGLWWALNARADNHLALDHPHAALADTERAYALAGRIGLATYISESARRMAARHAAQGDPARAYAFSSESIAMADKAARERASQRISELSQRYQDESRQHEIDRLKHQREKDAARNGLLLTILAASLLLLVAGAFFNLRLRETNSRLEKEIDERFKAEERLALKSHAIDQVHEAAYLMDEARRFHYVNAEACRALGYEREELLNMRLPDIDPNLSPEQLTANWNTLRGAGMLTLESEHCRKDGSRFPVEIHSSYFEFGGQAYILTLVRDISERKALESTLIAREQEFRTLAENLPDIIIRYDRHGRKIYVNAGLPRLTGRPAQELIGETPTQTGVPSEDFMQGYETYLRDTLATGAPHEFELTVSEKDQPERVFNVRFLAERDENGEITGALALARDITEQKRMEDRLASREREFRTLAENLPDNVVRYDLQCRKIYVNSAMSRMTGRPAEELIGEPPFTSNRYVNDSMVRYQAALEAALTSGLPQEIEFEIRNDPDGKIVHNIRFIAERDEHGAITGALAIGRDVTEQKRMEEALASREREFRTLAENLPDNVIRYNPEGRATYVNPNLLRITGTPAEALLGKTPLEFRDDPETQRYQAALERVLLGGIPERIEITLPPSPAGETRTHQVSFVAERRENGEIRGAIAIGRDITPLKETERRLAESHAQLRELIAQRETAREEERKRVAREIHDELGQNLTALKLGLNSLKFSFDTKQPILAERLGQLGQLTERSIQVVRDIATSLRPAALDMGIGPALEWLAEEFQRHTGIPCALDLNPPALSEQSDACAMALFRLTQEALTNTARYAEACQVWITLTHGDGRCMLELRDDGKGFSPAAVGKQSFGLVGMRERVHGLGGQLAIESAPGRGVRIQAIIPGVASPNGNTGCVAETDTSPPPGEGT
ncbi:MAG: PAS domain S-box protein [Pseudomonadota bacterium]